MSLATKGSIKSYDLGAIKYVTICFRYSELYNLEDINYLILKFDRIPHIMIE